jgi:hypothetical protein
MAITAFLLFGISCFAQQQFAGTQGYCRFEARENYSLTSAKTPAGTITPDLNIRKSKMIYEWNYNNGKTP